METNNETETNNEMESKRERQMMEMMLRFEQMCHKNTDTLRNHIAFTETKMQHDADAKIDREHAYRRHVREVDWHNRIGTVSVLAMVALVAFKLL